MKTWVLISLALLTLIGMTFMWTGCCTKRNLSDVEYGEADMASRVIKDLESGESKEDIIFNLKGVLDLKEIRK
jgi:hypothetical protein